MIKILVYRLIVYSGLLRFWIFKNRKSVNILMLHGVMSKKFDNTWQPFWNRISPDFLDNHLKLLSRYYKFISMNEAVEILSGRKQVENNCMVITFDDGYRNNLKYAMPVLRKYNVPATIYLATHFINDQVPFQIDRLDYALQTIDLKGRKFAVNNVVFEYDTTNGSMLTKSYRKHRQAIQSISKDEQDYLGKLDAIALELEKESGDSIFTNFSHNDWASILTWDEIRKYEYGDVQFEAHTVHHYKLALLEPEQVCEELSESRREIESELGRECKHLCYPVGSYNQTTVDIAKECGYMSAVTTNIGLNQVGCDLYKINRMPFPYEGDTWSNIICLSGLGYYLSSLIRRLKGQPATWV